MKATVHCFEIEDAKEHGVECAVILYNIRHWLDKNKANKKHDYDGRVWTYNSAKAFAELFPYLTQRQIYNRLNKLEESGLLISGNFNKAGYDRTKWYSLNEASYAILPNGEMDLPKRSNAFTESVEPIPDINTNINTDRILVQGKAFDDTDLIFDVINETDLSLTPQSLEEKTALLCLHIWHDVNNLQPNNKTTLKAKLGTWYHPIRLMIEQDDRTIEEIWKLWKQIQRDEFWKANILSPSKLREQFDNVSIKLKPKKQGISNEFINSLYE